MLDMILERVMRNLASLFWLVLSCKVTGYVIAWRSGFQYDTSF